MHRFERLVDQPACIGDIILKQLVLFLLQLMKFCVSQRILPETFGTSLTLTKADTEGQEKCPMAKALLNLDSVTCVEIGSHSVTVTKDDLAPW